MIRTVEQTGSTNADLAGRATAGEYLAEGDWLIADRQIAGRGRLGRVWNDGLGNFMGSTVVRIAPGDPAPSTLALLTGLAVHQAIMRFVSGGHEVLLKWPNDVVLDGGKVAGVLLEMTAGVVIVGIGVNLAIAPALPDRPVACLKDLGSAPDRDTFAQTLVRSFDAELDRWRTVGLAPLLRRWQAAAHPDGTPLRVSPPGEEPLRGTFAGLSDDGNLQLALPSGEMRTIHAGDVVLSTNRV